MFSTRSKGHYHYGWTATTSSIQVQKLFSKFNWIILMIQPFPNIYFTKSSV